MLPLDMSTVLRISINGYGPYSFPLGHDYLSIPLAPFDTENYDSRTQVDGAYEFLEGAKRRILWCRLGKLV